MLVSYHGMNNDLKTTCRVSEFCSKGRLLARAGTRCGLPCVRLAASFWLVARYVVICFSPESVCLSLLLLS